MIERVTVLLTNNFLKSNKLIVSYITFVTSYSINVLINKAIKSYNSITCIRIM